MDSLEASPESNVEADYQQRRNRRQERMHLALKDSKEAFSPRAFQWGQVTERLVRHLEVPWS